MKENKVVKIQNNVREHIRHITDFKQFQIIIYNNDDKFHIIHVSGSQTQGKAG